MNEIITIPYGNGKALEKEFIKKYLEVQLNVWTLSKKTYKSKCRYCGGDLEMYTHEDRNIIGDKGFTTVLCCKGCAGNVKIFSRTLDEISTAEKKALECFGVKENEK